MITTLRRKKTASLDLLDVMTSTEKEKREFPAKVVFPYDHGTLAAFRRTASPMSYQKVKTEVFTLIRHIE